MLFLVTGIYVFVCILLIIVVLLQQSKGGLFSGGSDTLLGASSGDVLTRTTAILAVIFVVGAIFLSIISVGKKSLIDVDPATPAKAPVTEEGAGVTLPGASNAPMALPTPSVSTNK